MKTTRKRNGTHLRLPDRDFDFDFDLDLDFDTDLEERDRDEWRLCRGDTDRRRELSVTHTVRTKCHTHSEN